MTQDTATFTDTPESLEAAVDAALDAEFDGIDFDEVPEKDETTEQPAEAAPEDGEPAQELSEDEPTSEDEADAPDEDTDSEEPTDEDGPQDDIATLAPPARWDAKGKEIYATMPSEAQAYVSARETITQGEITRQQQESARLRLELHNAKSQPDTELSQLLETAKARYDSQYKDVTEEQILNAVITGNISNEQAFEIRQAKAQEQAAIAQLETAKQTREQQTLKELNKQRGLEIQAKAPELASNVETQQRVIKFLSEAGYTDEQLVYAKADDLIMAHKAMLWDDLQTAKSKSKPAATRTGKVVKSTPTQSSGNAKDQKMAALRRKGTPEAIEQLIDMQLEEELGL